MTKMRKILELEERQTMLETKLDILLEAVYELKKGQCHD